MTTKGAGEVRIRSMAHQRTREELENALEVQRKAILASGKSYDEGNKWEALRLATAIYVVVHDGGSNKSRSLDNLVSKDH